MTQTRAQKRNSSAGAITSSVPKRPNLATKASSTDEHGVDYAQGSHGGRPGIELTVQSNHPGPSRNDTELHRLRQEFLDTRVRLAELTLQLRTFESDGPEKSLTEDESLGALVPSQIINVQGSWKDEDGTYGIFKIPRDLAKQFFNIGDDIHLYHREAVDELRKFVVDDAGSPYKFVTGPPGTGKSTNSFAVFVNESVENEDETLRPLVWWIDCRTRRSMRIVGKQVEVFRTKKHIREDKFTFLDRATRIIVDQFTGDETSNVQMLRDLIEYNQDRKKPVPIIVLSSMGVGKIMAELRQELEEFPMPVWNLEDYKAALRNKLIWDRFCAKFDSPPTPESNIDKLADEKFYYAGVSARYMFDYSIERIKADLLCALRSAHDIRIIVDMVQGSYSRESVNRLIYEVEGEGCAFSSRYIADQICEYRDAEWVIKILQSIHAKCSPGFLGHWFEWFVIAQIRVGRIKLPSQFMLKNRPVKELDPSRVPLDHWLRPKRWNNTGFDLVLFHRTRGELHTAVFLQVTIAARHDLKVHGFLECLQEFTTSTRHFNRVEIIFVVPEGRVKVQVNKEGRYDALRLYDRRWFDYPADREPIQTLAVVGSKIFLSDPN